MSINSLPKLTGQQRSELLVQRAMIKRERAEIQKELEPVQKGLDALRKRHFPVIQEVFAHKLLLKLTEEQETQAIDLSESAQRSAEYHAKRICRQEIVFEQSMADPQAFSDEQIKEIRSDLQGSLDKYFSSKKERQEHSLRATEKRALAKTARKKIYKSGREAEVAQRKINRLVRIVSKKTAEIVRIDARIRGITEKLHAGVPKIPHFFPV